MPKASTSSRSSTGRTPVAASSRDVVEEAGHRYEEWSLAWGTPAPRPLERLRGGDRLRRLDARRPGRAPPLASSTRTSSSSGLLEREVPLLGVCLGIQLIAKADGRGRLPGSRRPGDRLAPGRADARRRPTTPSSAGCPSASTRSAGTTTPTTCRAAPRSSPAAPAATRPTASARPPGGSSSTPR